MREKIMKRLFLLIAIAIIVVAIVIVKRQTTNNKQVQPVAEQKEYNTEIRIGISALDTFDPILSTNKNVQDVSKLVYESLVAVNENYKAYGELATEWAKTDEKTYLIKLKQGARWHNGTEFTAQDVEYTINKIKQASNSVYKDNVKNISQITIIDNYTIKLDLLEEEAFFEYNLIFPIQSLSDYINGESLMLSGTGTYKIYQISVNKIELVRNPYKENIEGVQLKNVIIKNYATIGELYNDFKIGNLDIINTDNINYSKYIGTLGYTTKNFYGRNFNFLSMNIQNPALYNIEVRRAISYAIDKNLIVSSIFNNKYYVADYPLDNGNWLYKDDSTSSGYNPEQSKQILKDSGWQYSNNVWQKNIDNRVVQLNFNLLVSSNDELRIKVAENIKEQLENVGIKINIVKSASITSNIINKNYDIALVKMGTSVSPELSILFGDKNISNYNNPEVLSIMDELKNIQDENLIKEKYNKLLEIYKIDIPFVSLYFDSSTLIYSSKLTGAITPTWYNLYYNIENWKLEI